jgi:hypothetical protein
MMGMWGPEDAQHALILAFKSNKKAMRSDGVIGLHRHDRLFMMEGI